MRRHVFDSGTDEWWERHFGVKKTLPDETFRSLVTCFPSEVQENATRELRKSVEAFYIYRQRVQILQKSVPALRKAGKAFMTAACVLEEIKRWDCWNEIMGYASMHFPDSSADDVTALLNIDAPQKPTKWPISIILGDIKKLLVICHDETFPNNEDSFLKTEDEGREATNFWENMGKILQLDAHTLYAFGFILSGVYAERGARQKISESVFASELRNIYNKYSGSGRSHVLVGEADSRGRKTLSKMGRFVVDVLKAMGEKVTPKALELILNPIPNK